MNVKNCWSRIDGNWGKGIPQSERISHLKKNEREWAWLQSFLRNTFCFSYNLLLHVQNSCACERLILVLAILIGISVAATTNEFMHMNSALFFWSETASEGTTVTAAVSVPVSHCEAGCCTHTLPLLGRLLLQSHWLLVVIQIMS